jgi:hypothetical protein
MKNVDNQSSDDVNWFDVIDSNTNAVFNNYTDRKQGIREIIDDKETMQIRRQMDSANFGLEVGPRGNPGGTVFFDWHVSSADGDYSTRFIRLSGANDRFYFVQTGTGGFEFDGGPVEIQDANNLVFGTGTGTKIGTATNQKIGFFNATPVVQPAANPDTSGATLAALETEVNQLKATLRSLGLLAP